MTVAPPWLDYKASYPGVGAGAGAGLPRAHPTGIVPMGDYADHVMALCFVGLLLLLLLFLVVRCVRILLDPYSSMPATSWSDHKEGLERGQFDFALG